MFKTGFVEAVTVVAMQTPDLVAAATTQTANTVRGVRPDQLDAATPCRDWDVRTLLDHLLQVVSALNLAGRREDVPDDLWGRDLMSAHWAAAFDEEARQAVGGWAVPAAADGTITMGSTQMPATFVAIMLAGDLVIHGWDLSRATDQQYHCDDEVAEATRAFVADTGDQGRAMGIYGDPVPVPGDASALDRALGLSGREPRWEHALR